MKPRGLEPQWVPLRSCACTCMHTTASTHAYIHPGGGGFPRTQLVLPFGRGPFLGIKIPDCDGVPEKDGSMRQVNRWLLVGLGDTSESEGPRATEAGSLELNAGVNWDSWTAQHVICGDFSCVSCSEAHEPTAPVGTRQAPARLLRSSLFRSPGLVPNKLLQP